MCKFSGRGLTAPRECTTTRQLRDRAIAQLSRNNWRVRHAIPALSSAIPLTRHEAVGLSTWLGAWAMLMPNTLHFTSEYNSEYSHFFSEYSQSTIFQSPSIECSFHIELSSM